MNGHITSRQQLSARLRRLLDRVTGGTARRQRLARDRLTTALVGLSEPQRSVYQLCAVEGLSYEGVATRLELTVSEVERALADALVALAADLEPSS